MIEKSGLGDAVGQLWLTKVELSTMTVIALGIKLLQLVVVDWCDMYKVAKVVSRKPVRQSL